MVSHGISTGALFILVGVIYDRRHTRDLADFGGLAKVMPAYAVIFVIVTMSSVGLPGTNGFVGEFMILSGSFVSGELGTTRRASCSSRPSASCSRPSTCCTRCSRFLGPGGQERERRPRRSHASGAHRARAARDRHLLDRFFPNTMLETMRPSVEHLVSSYTAGYTQDQHAEGAALRRAPPRCRSRVRRRTTPQQRWRPCPWRDAGGHSSDGSRAMKRLKADIRANCLKAGIR